MSTERIVTFLGGKQVTAARSCPPPHCPPAPPSMLTPNARPGRFSPVSSVQVRLQLRQEDKASLSVFTPTDGSYRTTRRDLQFVAAPKRKKQLFVSVSNGANEVIRSSKADWNNAEMVIFEVFLSLFSDTSATYWWGGFGVRCQIMRLRVCESVFCQQHTLISHAVLWLAFFLHSLPLSKLFQPEM